MEKKLEVRNLRISFRTNNGTVKAVRGIDFDLYKGETLAIVGESGSGKSVTSRAILGIQAANKIVESGEIIYDGKDLLKINEESFQKIRGTKISMIFQDPLSSLDPIMKIGRQMTEAMILKGKENQKEAKHEFNQKLKTIKENLNNDNSKELEMVNHFSKIIFSAAEEEKLYIAAHESIEVALNIIQNILDDIKLINYKAAGKMFKELFYQTDKVYNKYLILNKSHYDEILLEYKKITKQYVKDGKNLENVINITNQIKEIYATELAKTMPNFFAIACYYLNGNNQMIKKDQYLEKDIEELNEIAKKYTDEQFLTTFKNLIINSLKKVYENSLINKKKVLNTIKENYNVFEKLVISKKEIYELKKSIVKEVENSINKLEIVKDDLAYTFDSSFTTAIDIYFNGIVNNPKEQLRYEKEQKKYEEAIKKDKIAQKAIPPIIIDLELAKKNILLILDRLVENFEKWVTNFNLYDWEEEYNKFIQFLTDKASEKVHHITHAMAKIRAISLMKEVGISEPRKRFNQYPFEFSGGMRQRIVIAIALASNPDVLICDEPTTALDVTIQAQILELINKLKEERKLSIIFITHDLGVVANMADRIAVMYAGKIVEYGTVDEIFYDPKHPYTWALLSSMPDLDTKEKLVAIPGTPPNMIFPPKGDAFAARNLYAMKIDFEKEPPLFEVSPTHFAATWLLHPNAPKVNPPKIVMERIQRMKKLGGDQYE